MMGFLMARSLPTFWIKVPLAVGLVVLADRLLFESDGVGANMGLVTLAVALAVGLAHRAVWRSRIGLPALAIAAALGLVMVEHASFVAWLMFWTAMGVAVLAPRAAAADGAWQWAQRLAVLGLKALITPIADLLRLLKLRERRGSVKAQTVLLTLALPAIGGVVFFWLFAAANPVIGGWVAALRLPALDFDRIPFLGFVALLSWGALRPHGPRRTWKTPDAQGELKLPGVTTASITLSLALFNALFALQNGLDIAFLWSSAPLPDGMTLAEYAHRGAYPLIATALLAGLFVVVFLRPGTATANSPVVRRLVILWIVQNVFLVASTALRTMEYVDAYSLTRLRIAALIWMGLVAMGLGLIAWRLTHAKTTAWLINANVLSVAVVLAICSVVDLGAVAADWNVRHAREVGGRGAPLDVKHLRSIGEPALVSLAKLEVSGLQGPVAAEVARARTELMADLERRQSHWRTWTWRGHRRWMAALEIISSPPPRYPLTAPANPR